VYIRKALYLEILAQDWKLGIPGSSAFHFQGRPICVHFLTEPWFLGSKDSESGGSKLVKKPISPVPNSGIPVWNSVRKWARLFGFNLVLGRGETGSWFHLKGIWQPWRRRGNQVLKNSD